MSFGTPLAMFCLLAGVPIVAAYFLKRQPVTQRVSALFLWAQRHPEVTAAPRWQRFSREAALALELLAVALATLLLAQPRCAPTTLAHVTVIIDGRFSLQAVGADGVAVSARIRSAATSAWTAQPETRVTLIESAVVPRLLAGPQATPAEAALALSQWKPEQPVHDPTQAFALALQMRRSDSETILFFTDGLLAEGVTLPDGIQVSAYGQPLPNHAFTAAQRTATQVLVTVSSFETTVSPLMLEIDRGGLVESRQLEVPQSGELQLHLEAAASTPVRLRLPSDALELDNLLSFPAARALRARLEFLPGVDAFSRKACERAAAASGLLDGASETTFVIGPPGAAADLTLGTTGPTRTFRGPFFSQRQQSLLDDVVLDGVTWTCGENPPGTPLIRAGESVLATQGAQKQLNLNLALSRSTLSTSSAWPVLLANAMVEKLSRNAGFSVHQARLGTTVAMSHNELNSSLVSPTGEVRRFEKASGQVQVETNQVGEWRLTQGSKTVDSLFVAPLSKAGSDLRARQTFDAAAAQTSTLIAAPLDGDASVWLLLALLTTVVIHMWFTLPPDFKANRVDS